MKPVENTVETAPVNHYFQCERAGDNRCDLPCEDGARIPHIHHANQELLFYCNVVGSNVRCGIIS